MPIDRRTVLTRAAGLGLGAAVPRLGNEAPLVRSPSKSSFRAITYNVHAFGPVAATDEGKRLARVARAQGRLLDRYALELAQYEPDVVSIQEAASEEHIAKLAEQLGMEHVYFPGGHRNEEGRAHPMFNGAILTRHPILEKQDCPSPRARADRKALFSRHMGRVLLDTGDERWGDGGRVAVIGCHMLPSWDNTTSIREGEIAAVGEAIAADIEAGRSILVLGDMNQQPDSPEYAAWEPLGLIDGFTAKGAGARETIPSTGPDETIDYIFSRGPIAPQLSTYRTLAEGRFRAHGGGEESTGGWALSDHMPVLAQFG